MKNIAYTKERDGLHYTLTLQGIYFPKEAFVEFSNRDIAEKRVLCSENEYVADANVYRVLWKFEAKGENYLDKISPNELYDFFDGIKDDDVVNCSKQSCSSEKFIIVFYYDKR